MRAYACVCVRACVLSMRTHTHTARGRVTVPGVLTRMPAPRKLGAKAQTMYAFLQRMGVRKIDVLFIWPVWG